MLLICNMKKYAARDFQGFTDQERVVKALAALANELHQIYGVLWNLQEFMQSSSQRSKGVEASGFSFGVDQFHHSQIDQLS